MPLRGGGLGGHRGPGGQEDTRLQTLQVDIYISEYIYSIYNYIYSTGRLSRRHTCCGHTGWVRRLAIRGDTLVSGSLDMTLRVSRYL